MSEFSALFSFQHFQVWKEFAAGLDERSSVLALSVMFHQKAEQVRMLNDKNVF